MTHFSFQVTLRGLALLFKSTHVPPGDTLVHKGNSIYNIHHQFHRIFSF
jgi:hypothetical protein